MAREVRTRRGSHAFVPSIGSAVAAAVFAALVFAPGPIVSGAPPSCHLVLVDDPTPRYNLSLPRRRRERFGPAWTGEIVNIPPASPAGTHVYQFRGGTIVPMLPEKR